MAGPCAKINFALAEAPVLPQMPEDATPQQRSDFTICPDMRYHERAWDETKHGRASTHPYVDCVVPTHLDPGLAPAGRGGQRLDDVGGRVEVGLADLQVDDAASLRFQFAGLHQNIKSRLHANPAHARCELHSFDPSAVLLLLPKVRDTIPRLDQLNIVVDGDAVSQDAACNAGAVVPDNNRNLIGRLVHVGFGAVATHRCRCRRRGRNSPSARPG